MREIAVLSLTRLGDQIQVTPVLSGLRKRYPDARIHLVVKKAFRDVTDLLPGVDVIHEIDGDALSKALTDPDLPFAERYRSVQQLIAPLLEQRFDMALNLTHSNSSSVLLSMLNAGALVGATLDRQGGRIVTDPWLRHMSTLVRTRRLYLINLADVYLGAAGLLGRGERLSIRIPESARSVAVELLPGGEPRIAIQLAASDEIRAWPVERFAATLSHLRRLMPELRFVLVGVPSELPRARALQQACPEGTFENLIGKTEVAVLAGVVERMRLLLTNDTGTMHVAAAVGTPTCALFLGPAYPHETGPYAEGHWLIHSLVGCAPCNYHVQCGFPVCHTDVSPEWLAEVALRILQGAAVDEVSPLPRAELFRSGFDEDGLWELVPSHRRAPDASDLLGLVYRAVFVETLGGPPARIERAWARAAHRYGLEAQAWSSVLPDDLLPRLERCRELARRAEQLAVGLGRQSADGAAARRAGLLLAEVDREIYAHARGQPLLLPLGYTLEGDLLSLPEAELSELALESAHHYRALHRRVLLLERAIRGPESSTLSLPKEASP
jgi:ADP-heptose:LPS heptosyltransferase